MQAELVPEPWNAFFEDLDAQLTEQISLCCIGGFAITIQYGLARQTSDVDVLHVTPLDQHAAVLALAGEGRPLHRRHRVYLQHVGIVTLPHDYDQRLMELFPSRYSNIRLLGLDPYDLALSKLERNVQLDRDDVKYLAKAVPLDPATLEHRYRNEQRPYLANVERHDLTMMLWLDMLRES
ncbi:MAG TPA: DUF6036 family nucleotidyltransferase [Bryobacteraceae bacterium]|nr:DUF6036 family nucleotidyltransferase [Bryobacteraceae bacterium]